jgi:hypothetical protein
MARLMRWTGLGITAAVGANRELGGLSPRTDGTGVVGSFDSNFLLFASGLVTDAATAEVVHVAV